MEPTKRMALCIVLASLAARCWGATMLSTEPPSGVSAIATTGTATLQGTLTTDEEGVSTWFEWGQDPSFPNRAETFEIGDWDGTTYLVATLTNLQSGEWYRYRLAARTSAGTLYGAEQVVCMPRVTPNGANPTGISLGGEYTEPGATVTQTPLQISAGWKYTLLLKADGTISAWGNNDFGQTNPPPDATNIVAIAASFYHSVALRRDGTALAWGRNDYGQTNLMGATDLVAIAAGDYHTLALKRNGRPIGWGTTEYPDNLTIIPGYATNVVAIAVGGGFDLALRADGTIVYWGNARAIPPAAATNIVAISAAYYHSLALKSDGTVLSWGDNAYGCTTVPPDATNIVAIRAGYCTSSALRADGKLIMWGLNASGQSTAPASATNIVDWTLGTSNSTAIRADASLISWGDNASGQLNTPTNASVLNLPVFTAGTIPLNFPGNYTVTYQTSDPNGARAQATRSVVVYKAPNLSAPAITVQNNGVTMNADLGGSITPNGTSTAGWFKWAAVPGLSQESQPTALGNGNTPAAVGAGLNGLKSRQNYVCQLLASNSYGETLQSPPAVLWAPWIVLSGSTNLTIAFGQPFTEPGGRSVRGALVAVAVSESRSLVLRPDGILSASDSDFEPPHRTSNVVAIAAGASHAVALRADGSAIAWGSNSWGQTNIPANTKMTAIAAGYGHSLGVRSDGTVAAWGDNRSGQCNVPKGLRGVKAVAAGNDFSAALKHNGTVVAWGANSAGQLSIPADATNITAIAAGSYHLVALRNNGTVLAWGQNNSGQCTVPANTAGVVAVAASSGHCMVLKTNGTLAGWGDSTLMVNLNGTYGVTAINAGYRHGIAVRTNGSCIIWGDSTKGINPMENGTVAPAAARSGDTQNPGVHTLTYSFTNSLGAVAIATRTLTVLPPATEPMPVQSISQTSNGTQLGLTNTAGRTITVFTATNLLTPLAEWEALGTMLENPSGHYQFADPGATNHANRFYRFRSP